jgi:hypothetical protein
MARGDQFHACIPTRRGGGARRADVRRGGQSKASDGIVEPEAPAVGVGMICNTPEQARQYVEFRAGGAASEDAMQRVNEAAQNPHACGVAAIAFVPDKMLHCHFVENKLLEIVRVNVLAGFDGASWQEMPSVVQYAVMEGKGDAI